MEIDFHDQTNTVSSEHMNLVEQLLSFTAIKEKLPNNAEVSITFVNNDEIQEINRTYRNKDQPTDVISFALEEQLEDELDIIGDDIPLVLGDIVISVDKAIEQAEDYRHSFERELGFLAVHGFLHLLGYDHIEEADEKIMFAKQAEILGEFNLER